VIYTLLYIMGTYVLFGIITVTILQICQALKTSIRLGLLCTKIKTYSILELLKRIAGRQVWPMARSAPGLLRRLAEHSLARNGPFHCFLCWWWSCLWLKLGNLKPGKSDAKSVHLLQHFDLMIAVNKLLHAFSWFSGLYHVEGPFSPLCRRRRLVLWP